ncbi:hypothetical protein SAMN05216241_11012 [Limimonas halophila]|uniref:Uncharacterized protein n=1 Tax=Limimonas halophila TaxID=1082479 RepID=A0A1G7TQK6_9PROT|nr:hypothetical protein [Limimonas halophila]SDG36949.1 hypothetical protein SAMN05216241_11012 [Limimonas halophila]
MDLWTRYTLIGVAIAIAAVIGLSMAAGAETSRGYGFGLLIFAVAVLLEFRVVNAYFDARDGRTAKILPRVDEITPASFEGRVMAGAGSAVVAVAVGLSMAAGAAPSSFSYALGLLIFAAAVGYIFLLIKKHFDNRDAA